MLAVKTNIYLISTTDRARPDTIDIYNQLVNNWRFLVNINDQEDKERLKRDLLRVNDAYAAFLLLSTKLSRCPLLTHTLQQVGLLSRVYAEFPWPSVGLNLRILRALHL